MEARDAKSGANDVRNDAFWKRLHKTFRRTIRLIEKMATRQGIDLAEARSTPLPPRKVRTPDGRKLLSDSRVYAMNINAWFKKREPAIEEKRDELVTLAELEAPGRKPAAEAELIRDAFDVIQWYQFLIHVKLRRALEREDEDPERAEVSRMDVLGSAKVALIAIDRSLAAWHILYENFDNLEDEIIDFLKRQSELRNMAESLLPDAREFKRPGLDE